MKRVVRSVLMAFKGNFAEQDGAAVSVTRRTRRRTVETGFKSSRKSVHAIASGVPRSSARSTGNHNTLSGAFRDSQPSSFQ